MNQCLGVFPRQRGWRFATAGFPEAGEDDPLSPEAPFDFRTAEPLSQDGGFWRIVAGAAPPVPQDVRAWCDESGWLVLMRGRCRTANLGQFYDDHKNVYGWGAPAAIGVCHPYAAPPAVRRVLPALFDGEPTPPPSSAELSFQPLHTRLADGARLFAIESPIAGALEILAREETGAARFWVLCHDDGVAELAAFEAIPAGGGVELTLRRFHRLAAEGGPSAWPAAGDWPAERLAVFADDGGRLAKEAGQRLKIPPSAVVSLSDEALAAGAARYAALCLRRSRAPAGSSEGGFGLRVRPLCPWGVGVLGVGEGGAWFYHELHRPGEPTGARRLRLPAGERPRELLLAVRIDSSAEPATWLPLTRWRDRRISPWTRINIESSCGAGLNALDVKLLVTSGDPDHGWSSPTVDIAPSAW